MPREQPRETPAGAVLLRGDISISSLDEAAHVDAIERREVLTLQGVIHESGGNARQVVAMEDLDLSAAAAGGGGGQRLLRLWVEGSTVWKSYVARCG